MRIVDHGSFKVYYFNTKLGVFGFSCMPRPWFNIGAKVYLCINRFEVSINLPKINPEFTYRRNNRR